ncbi:MAG TPA: NUDIX hydrolase [Pirellulales bacterium]|nr:NUDIX hydrolase [Pirellulales bacterium]
MHNPSSDLGSRRVVAEGKHLRLIQQGHWEYAERTKAKWAVVLVAVTPDRRLLLTEQFRIPVGKPVIELPAGLVGDVTGLEDEEFEAAAQRELLEETGYAAGGWRRVASGPPTAGLASELVVFMVASDVERVADGGGDESEQIEVHAVPLDQIHAWFAKQLERDVLIDPKVYAGLYFVSFPSAADS